MGLSEAINRRFPGEPTLPFTGQQVKVSLGSDVSQDAAENLKNSMSRLGCHWGGSVYTLRWNDGAPSLIWGDHEVKIVGENAFSAACWAAYAVTRRPIPEGTAQLEVQLYHANRIRFSQSLTETLRNGLAEGPELGEKALELAESRLKKLSIHAPKFHGQPLRCMPKELSSLKTPQALLNTAYGLQIGGFRRELEVFLEKRRMLIRDYDAAVDQGVSELKSWLYTQSLGNLQAKLDTILPQIQKARKSFEEACINAQSREEELSLPLPARPTPKTLENVMCHVAKDYETAVQAGLIACFLEDLRQRLIGDRGFWDRQTHASQLLSKMYRELENALAPWPDVHPMVLNWDELLRDAQQQVASLPFTAVTWTPHSSMMLSLSCPCNSFFMNSDLYNDPKINPGLHAVGIPVDGLPSWLIVGLKGW